MMTRIRPRNTRHLPECIVERYMELKKSLEAGTMSKTTAILASIPALLKQRDVIESEGAASIITHNEDTDWPGNTNLSDFVWKIAILTHHTGNRCEMGFIVPTNHTGKKVVSGNEINRIPTECMYGFHPVSVNKGRIEIALNSLTAIVTVRRGFWFVSGQSAVPTTVPEFQRIERSIEQRTADTGRGHIRMGVEHERGKHHHGDRLGDISHWVHPNDQQRLARMHILAVEKSRKGLKLNNVVHPTNKKQSTRKRTRQATRTVSINEIPKVATKSGPFDPDEEQRLFDMFNSDEFWTKNIFT